MRLFKHTLIYLTLLLCSVSVYSKVGAAPHEKAVALREVTRAQAEIPDGLPPIQEQEIALTPFFRLQSNGSKVWIERILVTFMVAVPKNCIKDNFDNPTFRKMIYDLLQLGEKGATIQTQAVAHLKRQEGMKVDPTVQISRSVLIER